MELEPVGMAPENFRAPLGWEHKTNPRAHNPNHERLTLNPLILVMD